MKIKMPRGDYRPVKFKINNLKIEPGSLDEIYITCKKNTKLTEYLFQKRLSRGEITLDEENVFHFGIMPEDTEELEYKEYAIDIEIYNENPLIKQTIVGTLDLTNEVTFAENEV